MPKKSVKITLDKERHLRLNLNDLEEFERRLGHSPLELMEGGTLSIKEVKLVLWGALLHEDPELTADQVGEMVGIGNFSQVAQAIQKLLKNA